MNRFGHLHTHSEFSLLDGEQQIKKMIDSIGWETILNPETTILEPTAGDGAFTARILMYRLRKIFKESNTRSKSIVSFFSPFLCNKPCFTAFST